MAEVRYLDFDLLIERSSEKSYRVRVLSSPAGQATGEMILPFSDIELENFLLRVGRTRRGVRRLESPEMEAAKVFGGKLFKSVFGGDMMSCLRSSMDEAKKQNRGLRIRLRMNEAPELVNLPWEYLYNPSLNRFLSLSISTPLVRYLELPERIAPLAVSLPLRVLAIVSSPSDYPSLDVEQEWKNLKSALGGLEERGILVLDRLESASPVALQYSLRRSEHHIFHFIGHGGFNEQAQDGILLFEDDNGLGRPLSGQYLGTILHDESTLRLAVLNACEGARSGSTDPFAGVAQSLVQQGLPAVIAMQFEVTDQAAITFAREFYTAIAEGYPVDAALAEARKAIFSMGNDIEWGTPVLYMRAPNGQIFDVSKKPSGAQAEVAVPAGPPPGIPRRAARESSAELEQRYIDGLSAYWLQDWAKAWELFHQVVEIDPEYEDAASRLETARQQLTLAALYADAERAIQSADWKEALEALEQITSQEPGYKDAAGRLEQIKEQAQLADLYTQTQQLCQSGHWKAALTVFEQIHALQPDYPDPDGLEASAQREVARIEQEAQLQGLYRQALKAMDGGRWEEAQGLLTQIQQVQEDYNDTPGLLQRVQTEIQALTSQRERQELVQAAYQEAGELLRASQWHKALKAVETVRKLDPHFVDTQGIAAAAREQIEQEQTAAQTKAALPTQGTEAASASAAIPAAPSARKVRSRWAMFAAGGAALFVVVVIVLLRVTAPALPGVETIPVAELQPTIPWLPPAVTVFDTYTETTNYRVQSIYLNPDISPLDDVRVRRALAYAIDRKKLVDNLGSRLSGATPATTLLHPQVLGRDLYGQVGLAYDPEKARTLMAEAGYPDGKGFPQLTFKSNQSDVNIQLLQLLPDVWRQELGIDVKVSLVINFDDYRDGIKNNPPAMFRIGWRAEDRDPNLDFFKSGDENNFLNYSDPEFEQKLTQADANAGQPEIRQKYYIEAERILTERDVIVIPLYYETQVDKTER